MTSLNLKKGAMFGLDARIALAIFGALSVISGAALYSAIQSAKMEKYRQIFNEIVKASEAYYLDNGTSLPTFNATELYASDLVENRQSLSTWKGPYLSASKRLTTSLENISGIDSNLPVYIYLAKSSTWSVNNAVQACTIGSTDCAEWIVIHSGNTTSGVATLKALFTGLDELIDGSDGDKAGKLRTMDVTATDFHVQYRGLNRIRTN